jgi:hypothetical protein
MYVEFAGIPANLDPNLTGTVEERGPISDFDAFMNWLAYQGHQPPPDRPPGWAARAPVAPGSLAEDAGVLDIRRQTDQADAARQQAQQQRQAQQQQPPWSPQQ